MLLKITQKTLKIKVSEYGEERDCLDILLPNVGFLVFLLKWKSKASKSFVVGSEILQFVVYLASQNVSI